MQKVPVVEVKPLGKDTSFEVASGNNSAPASPKSPTATTKNYDLMFEKSEDLLEEADDLHCHESLQNEVANLCVSQRP